MIAAVALIAFLAADTPVANTYPGLPVALLACGTDHVTFARVTLHVRVAPEVCLTLVAPPAAESWSALTGTVEGIASTQRNILISRNYCIFYVVLSFGLMCYETVI